MQLVIGDKHLSALSMLAWLALQLTDEPCQQVPVQLDQTDCRARLGVSA